MSQFAPAFDFMIRNEDAALSGAVTQEPGGAIAKWGINSLANPGVDVAALTLDGAKAIYQRKYWAPAFATIRSQCIASKLFDAAVNLGFVQAVRLMQRAVNSCSLPVISEDGRLGPETLERVNALPIGALLNAFITQLDRFYVGLAQSKPEDRKFLAAWQARAHKLPAEDEAPAVA